MTIRFAAAVNPAHGRVCKPIARAMIRRMRERAANDHQRTQAPGNPFREPSPVFKAALKHFAIHGMGAAHSAQALAHRAVAQGDREGFIWWLSILAALDERLARATQDAVGEPRVPRATRTQQQAPPPQPLTETFGR
jgi:hypothetical protein